MINKKFQNVLRPSGNIYWKMLTCAPRAHAKDAKIEIFS
jgi:hypothetical protein